MVLKSQPDFAARLRSLLAEAGLSVPELVARSGLSRQHVHQLLDGTNAKPTWETVCKLAEGLAVSTEAFKEK